MLKNLSPILTGEMLRVLDLMDPHDTLALVSGGYPRGRIPDTYLDAPGVTIEAATEAILTVLPLSEREPVALGCWLGDDPDDMTADLAFTVNGLARDAELRTVGMRGFDTAEFDAEAAKAVATIRAGATTISCAFLLRKG